MLKKVLIAGVMMLAISLVFKCEQAKGLTLGISPCASTLAKDVEMVDGLAMWSGTQCDKRVIFYPEENDKITSEFIPNDIFVFCFIERAFCILPSCFSDDELNTIIDWGLYKVGSGIMGLYERNCLIMSAYSPISLTGLALMNLLFTRTEEYIIMENPVTGEDVYINGVDYIKFKGAPMVPLPSLLN